MFTLKYLFTICSKLIKQKYHLAIIVLVMFEIWREMLLLKSIIPFSVPKIIHWSAFIFVRTLLSVNHQGGNELQCSMNMHSWKKSAGRLLYVVEPNVKVTVKATTPRPHLNDIIPWPLVYLAPHKGLSQRHSSLLQGYHGTEKKRNLEFIFPDRENTGNLPKSI